MQNQDFDLRIFSDLLNTGETLGQKVRPLRERFKSGRVRLENDQIQPNLLDRSQVYRMATDFGVLSNFPNGSSTQMGKMAGDQCDSVRQSHRMPMADVARQFSSVANGVFLLLE